MPPGLPLPLGIKGRKVVVATEFSMGESITATGSAVLVEMPTSMVDERVIPAR